MRHALAAVLVLQTIALIAGGTVLLADLHTICLKER